MQVSELGTHWPEYVAIFRQSTWWQSDKRTKYRNIRSHKFDGVRERVRCVYAWCLCTVQAILCLQPDMNGILIGIFRCFCTIKMDHSSTHSKSFHWLFINYQKLWLLIGFEHGIRASLSESKPIHRWCLFKWMKCYVAHGKLYLCVLLKMNVRNGKFLSIIEFIRSHDLIDA